MKPECKSIGILKKDPNPVYVWDNGKTGDEQLIGWYTKKGAVIETNGDSVWETDDSFYELWDRRAAEASRDKYEESYTSVPLPKCCFNCMWHRHVRHHCNALDKVIQADGYCPLWRHDEITKVKDV